MKALIPFEKKYELVLKMDLKVIQFLPYQCQYIPIELI